MGLRKGRAGDWCECLAATCPCLPSEASVLAGSWEFPGKAGPGMLQTSVVPSVLGRPMVKQQWKLVQKKKGWVATTKSGHVVVRAESRSDAIRKTARVAREFGGSSRGPSVPDRVLPPVVRCAGSVLGPRDSANAGARDQSRVLRKSTIASLNRSLRSPATM